MFLFNIIVQIVPVRCIARSNELKYTDRLLKRNTWIAALIYVSKKEGKTTVLVVC